ncbi:MAG: alkaline phosphatase [Chloroflexi bacterium]|nr:alkaline phosphatase [Chloroflexota bacterium]
MVPVSAQNDTTYETGNVIFIHPDGTGLNHWDAGRMYWEGPDGVLEWDQLPYMAVYRGHMLDRLTGTSNGGATVHAFGYKVTGPGSFGQDGGGEEARPINGLSGFEGSIMREAAAAGYPVGVVNDGDAAEPGTAVFLTEAADRNLSNEIVRQMLDGRPGYEGEPLPVVILGGGERFFLPVGTPMCEDEITPDCAVHVDQVSGNGPAREDGRNLVQEAIDLGYVVIRTRDEFDSLMAELEADDTYAPMVLGLFAADDIFNDVPEETLISLGLVDDSMVGTKEGRLIAWGSLPGTLGYNPPSAAEMTEMALIILDRRSEEVGLPFYLVAEVESTDNLPNNANAIGMLRAVKRADAVVGVARDYLADNPDTLILTAADSDGGAPQVFSPAPVDDVMGYVTTSGGNPTGVDESRDFGFPLDGIEGQSTMPFIAAPDAFGNELDFAIGWPGPNDVAGAILSRADGLNAELLNTEFSVQFDNTDIYRMQYVTLFGELLPAPYGQMAPTRGE